MFIYLVGQKYLWQVIWFSLVNIPSTQKSPRVSDFQARWGIFFGKQQHGSDCWHWEPWGALGPPKRTRRRSDKPDHQLSASGNAWFRISFWFHLFVRRRWLTMNFTQCSSRLVRLCRQKSWGIKVLATVTATALCTINCPRMPPKQLPLSMDCRSFLLVFRVSGINHKTYKQVSNKRIKVSYSRPNTADIKDTNLYVGNVPQVEMICT